MPKTPTAAADDASAFARLGRINSAISTALKKRDEALDLALADPPEPDDVDAADRWLGADPRPAALQAAAQWSQIHLSLVQEAIEAQYAAYRPRVVGGGEVR